MTKLYCDLCGEEIKEHQKFSKYRVKKREHSWYESWWQNLLVHEDCWSYVTDYVRENKKFMNKL